MAPPTSTLPSSHPLIAELTSLRQQLSQYQKSGHQSAIQLQGAKLELNLAKDDQAHLREANETLRSELQILRTHPLPPTQPPTSTALAELTLAHRRLSTKLDLTEQALQSSQLELASCKQEIARLGKEREGDRAIINELRRGDEEREEEIAWERGERRKAEELKRLCDLAIDDYKDLVRSLDPNAVPPSEPKEIVMPTDLISSPDKSLPALPSTGTDEGSNSIPAEATATITSNSSPTTAEIPPSSTAVTGPEAISNLLIGQRGVNRLFEDFTQTLSTRDKEIHQLKDRLEEIEHTLSTITEQLDQETTLRISAESQRDTILRDDASAAKVVERYMTFTQKTHATVHLHLDNLRARAAATQLSLRKELVHTQSRLVSETERAERLRLALDEASENLQREVGGRRREVGLRLKMISNEERRERKIEIWLDRVRRQREGVEGAVLEADILESLLDEGIEAYNLDSKSNATTGQLASKDKQRSWKGMLGRKRGISNATTLSDGGEAASIARVLLAEELVDTLVKDLQVETERRMALEGERVEWLAKEAVEGVEAGEVGGGENDGHGDGVMFDLDQHEHEHEAEGEGHGEVDGEGEETIKVGSGDTDIPVSTEEEILNDPILLPLETPLIPLETPPPLEPTPTLTRLSTIFDPLLESHKPLQSSLNALSHSLSDIRESLPTRRSLIRKTPLQDPILLSILENLHESLEDARVDVEIAIADEDRVYRGFEALLGVGGGGVVQSHNVFEDAREFVSFKLNDGWTKLSGKVGDLEMDLSTVKSKIHELEGMDLTYEDESSLSRTGSNVETPISKPKSIWSSLDLKTVTLAPTTPVPEEGRRRLGQGVFGGVSSVGRSFSASVISAPRKVGGFAGGLYKPRNKKSEEVGLIQDNNDRGDDVE